MRRTPNFWGLAADSMLRKRATVKKTRARDLIPPPKLTVPPDEPPFEFERAKSRRRQKRGTRWDRCAHYNRYPAVMYKRIIYFQEGEPAHPGPLRE